METPTTEAKYECLLFDMDDTLYPLASGLNLACRKNIQDYMLHHLNIEENQVPKLCLDLYKEHGTTMAGLKELGYQFDDDEFHAFVHGRLPYETLKPDPVLRSILLSVPQRKIIFTNADTVHSAKVVSRLGLEDCFDGVVCFETLNPTPNQNVPAEKINTMTNDDLNSDSYENGLSSDCADGDNKYNSNSVGRILCKPSLEAFEMAFAMANIDPKRTIFFDDSPRNIATGKVAGLHTVLVGSSVLVPGADLALESIHNVREALPEIWQDEEQLEPVLAATSAEAVVLA
ncbi:uncharacterized protein LOC122015930 [Zingiber officinale]|uniref:uncharacterized protein LOC122015930 n=1 Tax=Zingiber officinale TaxID=94328 RepID=UPI001C4C7A87|nr:uncharacterized protein LOC122015930 [Zingiber officinale]